MAGRAAPGRYRRELAAIKLEGPNVMTEDQPPKDHVSRDSGAEADAGTGEGSIEKHLKERSTWMRLLFMIVFVILYSLSRFVVGTVVLLQFLWLLFTGGANARLTAFGASLATWTWQIIRYLTINTEVRPFPFDTDWPAPETLEPED